jgi:hypothetical protein
MREHIKAFLLASSLSFGIPTFVDAEPLGRAPGDTRADEARAPRPRSAVQREKLQQLKRLPDFTLG